jgi:hypothetical protein
VLIICNHSPVSSHQPLATGHRYVRFAENDEEIAFTRVLEVFGHMEIGIHAGLEHRDATQFIELRGVGFVVEGTGDEDIEPGVPCFAGGGDKIGALDGPKLGANENGGTLFGLSFLIAAFGANQFAGPRG